MSKIGSGIVIKRIGEDHDGNWKCNKCSFNHPSADKVFEHMRVEHLIMSMADLRRIKRRGRK